MELRAAWDPGFGAFTWVAEGSCHIPELMSFLCEMEYEHPFPGHS